MCQKSEKWIQGGHKHEKTNYKPVSCAGSVPGNDAHSGTGRDSRFCSADAPGRGGSGRPGKRGSKAGKSACGTGRTAGDPGCKAGRGRGQRAGDDRCSA